MSSEPLSTEPLSTEPRTEAAASEKSASNKFGRNKFGRTTIIIITAGSIIASITLGVRATMGLYIEPIEDALGVSTATLGLTFALQNLVWGLGQPIAGALADRFGSVRVLIAGAGIYAAGLIVMANATGAFTLHLGGGVIVGFGLAAASFTVVLASIGRLVDEKHRSTALGLVTACGSIGHFLLVPIAGLLIDAVNWSNTLVVMAIITVAIVLVVRPLRSRSYQPPAKPADTGLIGTGPAGLGPQAGNAQALADAAQAANGQTPAPPPTLRQTLKVASGHRSYLMLNAAFFACGFHVTFIALHLPKHLTDEGQTDSLATLALASIGLFNVIGAFSAGALGAKRDNSKLLSVIYASRAAAIGIFLLLPSNTVTVLLFGVALGLLWLATVPLTSAIVLSQFGPTHAGTLFGLVFWSHQVGAFVGAYGAGIARDATGSYTLWWWVCIAVALMAATLHLRISDAPVEMEPEQSQPIAS